MASEQRYLTTRVILGVFAFIVILPFLPLLIARSWNWWEAWTYGVVYILTFAISRLLAGRRYPDLLHERAQFLQQEDAKSWDKILAPLLGVSGGLALIIAGLDRLYDWTAPFDPALKLACLAAIIAGDVLGSYALIENRFFSGSVRIQADRGQHVVSTGPYRWLRHPGYAGAILMYLASPIFLDSLWMMLPILATVGLLVVRTALEDKVLQAELSGYREYAGRVRYRLLPGVW